MAGLFGLFNYEKEGPGVSKNAPKKNGFIVFFEIYFKNFWKLAVNGLWYWLFSILVLPIGFADAGMTNITRNMARDTHSFGTRDFFSTIKKNWKQALPAGILNIAIMALLIYDIYFFFVCTQGPMQIIGTAITLTLLVIFLLMRLYFWFLLTTFKLSFKQLYINSFKLSILGIKRSLLIAVELIAFYALIFAIGYIGLAITNFVDIIIIIFVLPGFRFLVIQTNIFKVIKKHMIDPYYNEHPDEDIELRRRLGVYEGDKPVYTEENLL